jgi:hypothetical protein
MTFHIGTRRKGVDVQRWSVYIPVDLALRFETLNMDTSKHKPIFGTKSQIITQLLEDYVKGVESALAETVTLQPAE